MKFKRKLEMVDAIQWRPSYKRKDITPGVYDPHEGYTIPEPCGYVKDCNGRKYLEGSKEDFEYDRKSNRVFTGDWVVKRGNGDKWIYTNERFKADYEQ